MQVGAHLKPNPQTLNPEPQTPNPKPQNQTLNSAGRGASQGDGPPGGARVLQPTGAAALGVDPGP